MRIMTTLTSTCEICAVLLAVFITASSASSVMGQTPVQLGYSITYQGRLVLNGVPVDDPDAEFTFRLYEKMSDLSSVLRDEVTKTGVPVVEGLFVEELDFDSGLFTGNEMRLEVTYTDTVSGQHIFDEQVITAAPYALWAKEAETAASAANWDGAASLGDLATKDKVNNADWLGTALGVDHGGTGATSASAARANLGAVSKTGDTITGTLILSTVSAAPTLQIRAGIDHDVLQLKEYSGSDSWTAEVNNDLYLKDTTSWRVFIRQGNGEVGIGTTDPQAPLHIRRGGNAQIAISEGPSRAASLRVDPSGTGMTFMGLSNIIYDEGAFRYVNSTSSPAWFWSLDASADSPLTYITKDAFSVQRVYPGTSPNTLSTSNLMFVIDRFGSLHLYPTINLPPQATPPTDIYGGQIYVGNSTGGTDNTHGELFAKDKNGSSNQLSSHVDPRNVDATAQTSFADPTCTLPISINHANDFLGEGCIIDLTKALMWIEREMQADLGVDEGRLFFYYDIQNAQSVDDYLARAVDQVIEKKLKDQVWIEIPLQGRRLPADVWEQQEIMEEVESEETVTEYEIDWNTEELKPIQVSRTEKRLVGTGRFQKSLKEGYAIREGKLCRQATVDDITVSAEEIPQLPDWVIERTGTLTSDAMNQKIEQHLSQGIERARMREVASQAKNDVIGGESKETAQASRP